jgi:hypothetical protein
VLIRNRLWASEFCWRLMSGCSRVFLFPPLHAKDWSLLETSGLTRPEGSKTHTFMPPGCEMDRFYVHYHERC